MIIVPRNSQSFVFPLRDGRPLNDDEVAGMLIGLLLAGQHTSSTTSAWMGFFLARDKALQARCYAEQRAVCGEDLPPLNFDQVGVSESLSVMNITMCGINTL